MTRDDVGAYTPNPWDEIFFQHGRVFEEPHESITRVVDLLGNREPRRVLDLGCGSGRHVVCLARAGFQAVGLDSSPEALRLATEWLETESLSADLQFGSIFEPLPFPGEDFDAVIGVQSIHHARVAQIQALTAEIDRVLRPGGVVFVTVPLVNRAGRFEEVEPSTLVPLDGPEEGLPHHYFSRDELRSTFAGYDVKDLFEDATQHLCLLGVKGAPW